MFLYKNEEREIFSIHINFRYAEEYGISNEDFLKAHLAEHLLVVNTCRQIQSRYGEAVCVEKYVSGLTNIESSCFQLSASNKYISYVNDFIEIVCNHRLDHITEIDFSEQVGNVLSEYDYPDNSYRGRCNDFYNFINGLEKVNFEEEINKITFTEIKRFIDERFVQSKCDIFYCGKDSHEIKTIALRYARKTKPKRICKMSLSCTKKGSITCDSIQNSQVWFAYQFCEIQSIKDYIISEIVAKTIQIVISLSNKATIETLVTNVGTHYTDNCAYALFSANIIYENLSFNYLSEQINIIISAVKEEYETRLLLKNDCLLETIKFYKKLLYITTVDNTAVDIKAVFNEIDVKDIYRRFEDVYMDGARIILQYIKDKNETHR